MKTTKINLNKTSDKFNKFVREAHKAYEAAWTIYDRPVKTMIVDGKECVVVL